MHSWYRLVILKVYLNKTYIMNPIRSFFILVLVIGSASVGAQPPEEKMLADDLMKQLVGFCKIVLEDMDPAVLRYQIVIGKNR